MGPALGLARSQPALVLNTPIRRALAALAACSFALPLRVVNVGEVEIPLAILMVLLAVVALSELHRIAGFGWLVASAALGLLSVCAWDISPSSVNSYRPYLSFVFFFLPYVAYASGYVLIRRREELARFFSISAVVASLAGIGILGTLLVSGQPVRIEGDLQGSLLGLPLYATHGVNSLAITEFILFAFIWIDVLFQRSSTLPMVILKLGGLSALGALVLFSLSRGAVLSLGVFVVLSLIMLAFRRPKLAAGVGLAVAVGAAYVGSAYGQLIGLAWDTRVEQTTGTVSQNDVDALTSGRLGLIAAALADLADNPVLGVGFTGFHEGKSSFDETEALNSSPHNQFLTILWKAGVLSGGLLILFLARCMLCVDRLKRRETEGGSYLGLWCLAIVVLGIACFTWDVLLVPNIGAVMMFLFGACASIVQRRTAEVAA